MRSYELSLLQDKCEKMLDFLKQPLPHANESDYEQKLMERMRNLGIMLAQSSEYLAVAKYKYDEILHGEIGKAIMKLEVDEKDDKNVRLTASTLNLYLKAAGREWSYVSNCMDRINASASKMIEAIRTLLSFEKSKMNLL